MKRNNLNTFNNGGSHSENPLGGIPLGINEQGQQNSVEEGETMKNDFIYSDRIKLNKDMIAKLNLPKSLEGKSVAEATKFVDSKFKDRTDKISMSTKNGMLDKIAKVQEEEKARQASEISEALNINSTELPQDQMFLGGFMNDEGALTDEATAGISGGINALGSFASGDNQSGFMNVAKTGASVGLNSLVPGLGFAAGPAIDILGGIFNGFSNKKKEEEQARNNAIINSSKFSNDFALGGTIQNPSEGTLDNNLLTQQLASQYNTFPNGIFSYSPQSSNTISISDSDLKNPGFNVEQPYTNNKLKKANLKPIVNWMGENYGNLLRYAPVAANTFQLNSLNGPEVEKLNRIDQRFRPEYVDERSLQNLVSNEYDNTINSLTNASNGSLGTLRNNILGAGVNRTKALSDAYIQTAAQNRATNIQGQQFDLGVNQFNVGQDNLEKDINARNRGAYETNKSRLIGQLGTDIGNIGKEEVYKNIAKNTFGYTWDGKYWIKPDGSKATDEQVKKEVESTSNIKALGGYVKKMK